MDNKHKLKLSILDDNGVEKINGLVDGDIVKNSINYGINSLLLLYQQLLKQYNEMNEKKYQITLYSPTDFSPKQVDTIFPDEMIKNMIKCFDELKTKTDSNYTIEKIYSPDTEKLTFGIFTNDDKEAEYIITVNKKN